jgi:DNA polymerase III epsilon subunit-like protein
MDGKEYYMDVSNEYNFIELIEYFEEKILLDQLSIRPKPNLDYILQADNIQILNNNLSNKKNLVSSTDIIYNMSLKNNSNLIMVLDTETTDFVGDIIQLAWAIADVDKNYKIIKKSNKFIKDRIPSTKSAKIHGIDVEKLRINGMDFFIVMKEFIKDLELVGKVVGHNIHFDLRMIINNMRKFCVNILTSKTKQHILNIFENVEIVCTKKLSNGKSLENLYLNLFGSKFSGAHDAMVDVESTLECYIELMKKENSNKIILNHIV